MKSGVLFRLPPKHLQPIVTRLLVLVLPLTLQAQPPGWEVETVDGPDSTGYETSLRLDATGHPHVAYRGWGGMNVRYAHKDPAGWHVEAVDTAGTATALALGPDGTCHVTYGHLTLPLPEVSFVKHAERDDSGWTIETVDTEEYVGLGTSVALDDGGNPHVGYCRSAWTPNGYVPQDPKYAWRDGRGWHIEAIDDGGSSGAYASVALEPSGVAHMAYCTMISYASISVPDRLRHATRTASGWVVETLTPELYSRCESPSLALDAAGAPHIAYTRGGESLWYAVKGPAGWVFEVADDSPATDYLGYVSLALDPAGFPHISYYRSSQGLKYAYRDPAGWHVIIVDTTGEVGLCASIQLGPLCRPRISFWDWTNFDLKYAQGPPTMPLVGAISGGQFDLWWIPADEAAAFWLFGAPNDAHFVAGTAPDFEHRLAVLPPSVAAWSSPNGVYDPGNEWTYLLIPVDAADQEITRSNRLGERDTEWEIPW
ncbi:MAG: hypothetical protein MUE60_03075 [Candidatus Eisenbacteria bacterium]|jgi:hypothetical protein|nr:hypothetical protein [Candidatus Eisenbacteria bacterium]